MKTIKGLKMSGIAYRREESIPSRLAKLGVGECVAIESDRARGTCLNAASGCSTARRKYSFRLMWPEVPGLNAKEQIKYVRECGRVATVWRIK